MRVVTIFWMSRSVRDTFANPLSRMKFPMSSSVTSALLVMYCLHTVRILSTKSSSKWFSVYLQTPSCCTWQLDDSSVLVLAETSIRSPSKNKYYDHKKWYTYDQSIPKMVFLVLKTRTPGGSNKENRRLTIQILRQHCILVRMCVLYSEV